VDAITLPYSSAQGADATLQDPGVFSGH